MIIPVIHVHDWLNPDASEADIEAFIRPADTEGWEVYEVGYEIAKKKIKWADDDLWLVEPKGELMVAAG